MLKIKKKSLIKFPYTLILTLTLILITNSISINLYSKKLPVMRGVGGNFVAASSLGYDISLSDYKNNIVLLTFGFTNCPDVCPITLGYLHYAYSKLNESEQKKVKILFVTVDSVQDTPEHLKKYLEAFHESFVGISPTPNNLKKIAKNFGIKYEEVKQIRIPTQYNRSSIELAQDNLAKTFNHSISIFLLDKNNKTRGIYYSGSDSDGLNSDIRSLLKEKNVEIEAKKKVKVYTQNFWIRWLPAASKVTALYGKIVNNSDKAIKLEKIECGEVAKKTELHLSILENDVAKMLHQENILIRPNSTLTLKPMSYHTMLMGLKKELIKNQKIACTLIFNDISEIKVKATVK